MPFDNQRNWNSSASMAYIALGQSDLFYKISHHHDLHMYRCVPIATRFWLVDFITLEGDAIILTGACLASLNTLLAIDVSTHSHPHTHAHTHSHPHTHAHTHTHTHTHTHMWILKALKSVVVTFCHTLLKFKSFIYSFKKHFDLYADKFQPAKS